MMFNIKSTIVEGDFDKMQGNTNAIAIGSGVAEKLSLKINDNINITSSNGVNRNLKVAAIFKTNNSGAREPRPLCCARHDAGQRAKPVHAGMLHTLTSFML